MTVAVLLIGAVAPLGLFVRRSTNGPAWRMGVTVSATLAVSSLAGSPLWSAVACAATGVMLRRRWSAKLRTPTLLAAVRSAALLAAVLLGPNPATVALAVGSLVAALFPSERVTLLLATLASVVCGVGAAFAGDGLLAATLIVAGVLHTPVQFLGARRSRELRRQNRRGLAGVR